MLTIDVNVTSPECECIGSEVSGSIPGLLGVSVGGVEDTNVVSFISITSPNGTEAKIATVRSLDTGTVAFNGFPANGSWVIKLLDASGNLSTQTASTFRMEFGLIGCGQVLPTPDCAGNFNRGNAWVAENLSLVGTALSPSPTLLHFDVEASSACCVPPLSDSGNEPLQLSLEFDPLSGSSGRNLTAGGLSPDAVTFNLTSQLIQTRVVILDPSPRVVLVTNVRAAVDGFAARAAGLWTLNTSTDGATAVINNTFFRNPQLLLTVVPCT